MKFQSCSSFSLPMHNLNNYTVYMHNKRQLYYEGIWRYETQLASYGLEIVSKDTWHSRWIFLGLVFTYSVYDTYSQAMV